VAGSESSKMLQRGPEPSMRIVVGDLESGYGQWFHARHGPDEGVLALGLGMVGRFGVRTARVCAKERHNFGRERG